MFLIRCEDEQTLEERLSGELGGGRGPGFHRTSPAGIQDHHIGLLGSKRRNRGSRRENKTEREKPGTGAVAGFFSMTLDDRLEKDAGKCLSR